MATSAAALSETARSTLRPLQPAMLHGTVHAGAGVSTRLFSGRIASSPSIAKQLEHAVNTWKMLENWKVASSHCPKIEKLEPVLDKWKYQVNIIELTSGNTFRRQLGLTVGKLQPPLYLPILPKKWPST